MAAKLVAEEGALKGLVLSLEEGDQWVIGRDPDECQLLVEDPLASRRHLLCRNTPSGISVENLSVTNPVEVNAEKVEEPRILQNGDSVKIGSGLFRFYIESAAQLFDMPQTEERLNHAPKEQEQENTEREEEVPRRNTIFEDDVQDDKQVLAEVNFDILQTGRWLLKVIGGPNNGAEFSMQPSSSYTLGTDPNSCDIVFHDTSVSRQHARITIAEDSSLIIEDLKSRNGTLVDGQPLKGKMALNTNTVVSVGTSSFIVYDREGEMQTIISPLLPSIVKVLQKEEPKKEEATAENLPPQPVEEKKPEKHGSRMGSFILVSILTGLFLIAGIGAATLFKSDPVELEAPIDYDKALKDVLNPFLSSIKYSFTKNTGRLLLIGHVSTANDLNQIRSSLQGLPFIRSVDDNGIVIDEGVTREINPLLARNPNWRGVTIQSPRAGSFKLTGYLQSRAQAERLSEYISANFQYLDLLEQQIIVEEDVINSINTILQNMGIKGVSPQIANGGEITLTGAVHAGKDAELASALDQIKSIPGVRSIKNFISLLAPEQSLINITDKYEVSGFTRHGSDKVSVLISGKIVTTGDVLDGMTITSIKPNAIFLEKEGVKYRIDYGK